MTQSWNKIQTARQENQVLKNIKHLNLMKKRKPPQISFVITLAVDILKMEPVQTYYQMLHLPEWLPQDKVNTIRLFRVLRAWHLASHLITKAIVSKQTKIHIQFNCGLQLYYKVINRWKNKLWWWTNVKTYKLSRKRHPPFHKIINITKKA